jgi:hypothetical protein
MLLWDAMVHRRLLTAALHTAIEREWLPDLFGLLTFRRFAVEALALLT